MAGTRTAPTVDATPDYQLVSIRYIDANGDKRSDSSIIDTGATDAEVEDLIAKMQLGTNASIYEVRLTGVFKGAISSANADDAVRVSADDNIVYHAKDSVQNDRRAFVPAPIAALFVAGTEVPDAAVTILDDIIAAWDVVWAGTYAGLSLRFTERREINEKINL